jgi:hypothetical protein
LLEKQQEILQEVDTDARKKRASEIYNSSRQADWFEPVITALRGLCGQGELCMYCSSTEPSQVEHFRPLALFPERALDYSNYLWSCDICNRYKGNKFPPHNHPGEQILNPLDDDVWEHFFIDDEFGRLLRRVSPATGKPLPQAVSTCEVVGIDRENVQIKRSRRYRNLRHETEQSVAEWQAGTLSAETLRCRIADWRSEPFQADVADYFLNGPGRVKEPFKTLLLAIGERQG